MMTKELVHIKPVTVKEYNALAVVQADKQALVTVNTRHELCVQQSTQLSSVVKNPEAKAHLMKIIQLEIINTWEWHGKELAIELVQELANTIYSSYYYWKFAELRLFFLKLRAGKLGGSNKNITPPVLLEYMEEWDRKSWKLRQEHAEQQHDSIRKQSELSVHRREQEVRDWKKEMQETRIDQTLKKYEQQAKHEKK